MAGKAGLCLAWSETPPKTRFVVFWLINIFELEDGKTNKMTCVHIEDKD